MNLIYLTPLCIHKKNTFIDTYNVYTTGTYYFYLV